MVTPRRSYPTIVVAVCVLGSFLPWAGSSRAEDFRLESAGARGGFSSNRTGKEFYQAEAFGNCNLPWGWDLGGEWHLQSRLDFSVGWLGDRGNNAAIGTVGPSLVLSWERLPLALEGGSSPTFLSTHQFGTKDFGTEVQFTSHVGVNWDFAEHWRIGYRFQHMSNAGLSSSNPGLNMHMFSLSYRF